MRLLDSAGDHSNCQQSTFIIHHPVSGLVVKRHEFALIVPEFLRRYQLKASIKIRA